MANGFTALADDFKGGSSLLNQKQKSSRQAVLPMKICKYSHVVSQVAIIATGMTAATAASLSLQDPAHKAP